MHSEKKIKRFSKARVMEHWLLIVTFSILVATGLSQKYYYLDICMWFIIKLGGIDTARLIHRYTGLIFFSMTSLHVAIAITAILLKKWDPSMLITKNDIHDAVHNIKYYIGVENHPAKCDRYDYKEKFGYWLVLSGGLIMIATGFALWFPITAVRFLPGEFIPAAKALHSNEALLILIIVALWHIYDSIFSPNVFPLDTSIFTGRISRERMLGEHPLELARLEGKSIDDLLTNKQKNSIPSEKLHSYL